MSHTTILFDLDGTLVETAPDLLGALNEVMRSIGAQPMSLTQLRTIVGQGARVMIERGLQLNGRSATQDELDDLIEVFLAYYGKHIANESKPFPGVINCLDRLRESGARLAVCTNKYEEMSVRLLKALDMDKYFEIVAGGDTYPVRKPHPDHLLVPMRALGGAPARTVMVGDSLPDIEAAKRANIPVVGVTFGYTDVPVADLEPNAVIDHFDDLVPTIDRLTSQ